MIEDLKLQRWYDDQFDMFNSDGWKALMEQATELKDGYELVSRVTDEKDLYKKQGFLEMINWLLRWEDMVTEQYKDLANEQPSNL